MPNGPTAPPTTNTTPATNAPRSGEEHRATTTATPAPVPAPNARPCSTRPAKRAPTPSAPTNSNDATADTPNPHNNNRRGPTRSTAAPNTTNAGTLTSEYVANSAVDVNDENANSRWYSGYNGLTMFAPAVSTNNAAAEATSAPVPPPTPGPRTVPGTREDPRHQASPPSQLPTDHHGDAPNHRPDSTRDRDTRPGCATR